MIVLRSLLVPAPERGTAHLRLPLAPSRRRWKWLPLLMVALGFVAADGAVAQSNRQRRELVRIHEAVKAGLILPLRHIQPRVLRRMRGWDYLGAELELGARTHRFKFIRGGRVAWVDVDAKTGRIIGHTSY